MSQRVQRFVWTVIAVLLAVFLYEAVKAAPDPPAGHPITISHPGAGVSAPGQGGTITLVDGDKAPADLTWHTTSSDHIYQAVPAGNITFLAGGGKTVLIMTSDGRIIVPKGVKPNEAAKVFLQIVREQWRRSCTEPAK